MVRERWQGLLRVCLLALIVAFAGTPVQATEQVDAMACSVGNPWMDWDCEGDSSGAEGWCRFCLGPVWEEGEDGPFSFQSKDECEEMMDEWCRL